MEPVGSGFTYFYGGNNGVAGLRAEKLTEKFPGLIMAGTYCPHFRPLTKGKLMSIEKVGLSIDGRGGVERNEYATD